MYFAQRVFGTAQFAARELCLASLQLAALLAAPENKIAAAAAAAYVTSCLRWYT